MKTSNEQLSVMLQIHHKDLNPEEITSLLKLEPTSVHLRGDSPFTQWILEAPSGDSQSARFEWIATTLLSRKQQLSKLVERGIKVRLVCQIFTSDEESHLIFSPQLMAKLGDLGLNLLCEINWTRSLQLK